MVEAITPQQFHEAEGVGDWRALGHDARAYFTTGSFAKGAQLVAVIDGLAGAANHHPDVDLRYAGVTVRLTTHDAGGLSRKDVALAREISAAARGLGIGTDPARVQDVQLTIDALSGADVTPFWRAVLGYADAGDESLADPRGSGPPVRFQELDAPRPQRNRIRVDVWVPHDQADPRVAAAIAAGGHLVSDAHAPASWTLADAEGNEADVATWAGRG